jgi:prolyl oligopeptidase
MTARLQAATTSGLPVLLRAEAGTGHVGTPLKARNELSADIYSFLFDQLQVKFREPARGRRAGTR